LFLAAVGEFDGRFLRFVFVDFFLFAGLRGGAFAGFEFVRQSVNVSAPIGEDALDGE
jgi:hypothetical protein